MLRSIHLSKRTKQSVLLVSALLLGLILFSPLQQLVHPARAGDLNLAQTPPMGWNSWNAMRCRIDEQSIRETADAMVASGMRDAGYRYLVIDDCWQTGRSEDGLIHASTRTFPSGMGALAEYIHARGLLFGIYTSAGQLTCQGRPGSLGYEAQDIATYAAWGVDYVKIDWCFADGLDAPTQYARWRDAIAASSRPMVLSISAGSQPAPERWAADLGHLWRTTDDIRPEWPSILHNLDTTAPLAALAGPGHWNDPDMLEVGNGDMTLDENKAHMSMWALLAAPLMAGNDLRRMSVTIQSVLTNPEVIAVNQDPAGIQGTIVDDTGTGLQVWMRPLADGSRAVALLNRTQADAPITALWEKIGLPPGEVQVHDLWSHTDLGSFQGALTLNVPAHGVMFVKISSSAAVTALSDLTPISAYSGFGPIEIDRSNGEFASGDGQPLTLNGRSFVRGLGVHAPFDATYQLDGRCSRLHATLGIDDEVGANGSVTMQVWADDQLILESGILRGDTEPFVIDVDLHAARQLRLVVTDASDGSEYDHADWAGTYLSCSQ